MWNGSECRVQWEVALKWIFNVIHKRFDIAMIKYIFNKS